jgi:hypothetical protein
MDDQSTEIHKVRKSKSIAFRSDLEGAPTFRRFVMTGLRLAKSRSAAAGLRPNMLRLRDPQQRTRLRRKRV